MNPSQKKFTAYYDNTFELTLRLQDENGTAIPASTYTTIEHHIYDFYDEDEDTPLVSNTLVDGITVTSGNILSWDITADQNKTLHRKTLKHKLIVTYSGSKETFISGKYVVDNDSGSQNDGDYTLKINQSNLDITLNLTEASVATASALQAKADTQALKDSIEWKGVYNGATTYAEDNRVSYQGSSFISLQDSNTGNTPVGDAGDTFWDVIAEKGDQGIQGIQGIQGVDGNEGWSPVFAVVSDGTRRVLQVSDWVGGEGTKPAVGDYVGATGLESLIANAVDIRGEGLGTHEATVGNHSDVDTTGKAEGDILQFDVSGNLIVSSLLTEINDTIDTDPFLAYVLDSLQSGATVNDIDATRQTLRGFDS